MLILVSAFINILRAFVLNSIILYGVNNETLFCYAQSTISTCRFTTNSA